MNKAIIACMLALLVSGCGDRAAKIGETCALKGESPSQCRKNCLATFKNDPDKQQSCIEGVSEGSALKAKNDKGFGRD